MAPLFLCCLGLFFMALPGVGGKCYWEPRELKEAGAWDFFRWEEEETEEEYMSETQK